MQNMPLIPRAPLCGEPVQQSFEFPVPDGGSTPGHLSVATPFGAWLPIPQAHSFRVAPNPFRESRLILSVRLRPTRQT